MIKLFKLFESHSEIDKICQEYGIYNYTINSDGSIDVDGDVDLDSFNLSKIPLKFGTINGDFFITQRGIKSLDGSPRHINGGFYCGRNQLRSLEGGPSYIRDDFWIQGNGLTSLKGFPEYLGGGFYCKGNQLTSFDGISGHLGCGFYCEDNPIYEIYDLFHDPECIEWINEYDVIQGRNVIRSRLEEVFYELGLEIPDEFNFEYYTLVD